MATKTKRYYAASYPYGIIGNGNGGLIRQVVAFASQDARNEWVDQGAPGIHDNDYREIMPRSRRPTAREIAEAR